MATQEIMFAGKNTIDAVVSESKKYSKKVSQIVMTTDSTTDPNATIYTFKQNNNTVGSIKIDKENFIKEATVVNVAENSIVDPSNPGTEESPNYLAPGQYIKMVFENEATSAIYISTSTFAPTMQEITAEEVTEMFKDDIVLSFSDSRITVEAKGQQLNNSDIVKEGWVLTISAPTKDPTDSTKTLTVIVVNDDGLPSLADNEDNTKKIGTYTVTAADEQRGRITLQLSYNVI